MTLTFPRRRAPALLALATTAILALLLWRIARQTPLHGGHLAFCALLLAYSGYTALRESHYLIRPETLRLDTRGLTLRHHRAPGWRALRLPWTDLIDQETRGDRLTLIWRDGDRLRAFTLRLPAQPRSAEIAATIARYPPRPVPWPPVAISADWQQHWDTGEPGIRTALYQYGIETLYSPLILTILLIAVPLLDRNYGAISATLAALLLARAAWRRYRTPQHYRIALHKPYIRLDADGVHYWHAPPDDETHIPWAAIHAVNSEHVKSYDKYSSYLHLTWRPHPYARYLRHDRLRIALSEPQNRDNQACARCDEIAASIAAHLTAPGEPPPALPVLERHYGL